MESTEDGLLGQRLVYRQPRLGFRSGLQPVLLAAAIPARAGERVLEVGTGAGAGLLCLASRVPGAQGLGVEVNRALATLACGNARANRLDGLAFITGDAAALPLRGGGFDHAFANPPYHSESGAAPLLAERALAKHANAGLLGVWTAAMARCVRPRGSITFILPAAALPALLNSLDAAECGSFGVYPLWPRLGQPAKLVIARAVRQGRSACTLLPGLVLHEADGAFTVAASEVLRDGAALPGLYP